MTKPTWQDFATHDESAYPELWDGVVGAWAPCLGPTGSRLHDHSRRGNWGTLTNMDPPSDWVVDGGQYALDFDGSNDRVLTENTIPNTQQLTIEGWVKTTTALRSGIITIGAFWTGAYIDVLTTGVIRCAIEGNSTTFLFRDSSAAVANQGWRHIAMTATPTAINVFVDGVNVTTGGGSGGTLSQIFGGAIQLGNGFATPYGGFLSGQLDSFSVCHRIRAVSEIRQLYQLGRGGMYQRRRRSRIYIPQAGFQAAWARRQSQIIGGGL